MSEYGEGPWPTPPSKMVFSGSEEGGSLLLRSSGGAVISQLRPLVQGPRSASGVSWGCARSGLPALLWLESVLRHFPTSDLQFPFLFFMTAPHVFELFCLTLSLVRTGRFCGYSGGGVGGRAVVLEGALCPSAALVHRGYKENYGEFETLTWPCWSS